MSTLLANAPPSVMRPSATGGAKRTLASVPMQICRRRRRRKFDMPLSSFKRVDPHSLTLRARACRRVRGSQHRSRRRSVPRLPLPSSAGGRSEYKRFGLDRPIAACNFTRLLLSPTPPAAGAIEWTNELHALASFFLSSHHCHARWSEASKSGARGPGIP